MRPSTRRATSGLRCAAPPTRPCYWRAHRLGAERRLARRLPQRPGWRRSAAPNRRRRARRPLPYGWSDWADEEGARFGRSLFGSPPAAGTMDHQEELRARKDRDGIRCPTRFAGTMSTLTRRSTRAERARRRGRLPRAPHRARAGAGVARSAAGSRARHLRRRAPPGHLSRTGRARRLDADGQAPRRARGRRATGARDPRDREADRRGRGLHDGRRRHQARHRHVGRRNRGVSARPAPSRRRRSLPACSTRPSALRALRARRGKSTWSGSGSGTSSRSFSTSD